MPPSPASPSPGARTAAQVNDLIRSLFRPGCRYGLSERERLAYERLLEEYAAARRAEEQAGFVRAA